MSSLTHILAWFGAPTAFVVAVARSIAYLVRARLLIKAGSAAIAPGGDEDKRREAALKVVSTLTGEGEPWYRAILPPWRKPDDEP